MGTPSHRFRSNSPNSGVLNMLIVLALILSLWNLWASQPATIVTMSPTVSPNAQELQEQNRGAALSAVPYLTLRGESSTRRQMAPIVQDGNGHHSIFLSPEHVRLLFDAPHDGVEAVEQESSPMMPQAKQKERAFQMAQTAPASDYTTLQTSSSHEIVAQGSATTLGKLDDATTGHHQPSTHHQFTHASPIFAQRVRSMSPSKVARALHSHTSSELQNTEPLPRALGLLVVASGGIIMGAIMAKRAMDYVQRWEQQSQEDSLAYDMAYSEIGYGSFVSATWSEGDALDKFDI